MKVLPHRLKSGQCRDCGKYDPSSAPRTCCRCALSRYAALGYPVVLDMRLHLESWGREMWRGPVNAIASGAVKSDRFYLYVGHNDGDSMTLPMGKTSHAEWERPDAAAAHEAAQDLMGRYAQVWVVTTVGCWSPDKDAKS